MCLYLARWVYLCSYCYSLCLESPPQANGQTAVNNSITETAALFNAKSANRRDNGQKNSRPSSRRQSALLLYDTVAHQAINVLYSLELSPVPTVWPIKSVRVNSPVLRRGAAVLFAKSGGLVPYSLAKALVKSANKGSKKTEKLHK